MGRGPTLAVGPSTSGMGKSRGTKDHRLGKGAVPGDRVEREVVTMDLRRRTPFTKSY